MSVIDTEVRSQYEALNAGVGIVSLGQRSLLEVAGADRASFINSFCTNDVKRLQVSQGCEAFFTNHQGKAAGHGLIFAHEDSLLIETTAGQAPVLIQHLDRFLISERVEFRDRSAEWKELLVGGERAGELLQSLTGGRLPENMLAHDAVELAGQRVVLRRVGFTRAPGWLVQVEGGAAEAVLKSIVAAGAVDVRESVLEMCRLEAGWPWYGTDITLENLPQEIDRNEQAISFKKGCYLGQETVARLDALGHVNRLLVGLKLSPEEIPARGAALVSGDKEVGQITSAAWSPALSVPIALALVRRSAAKAGTSLNLANGTAEVIHLPIT